MSQLYLVSSDQLKAFAATTPAARSVRLSSYYDAAASTRDVDWQTPADGYDDSHFNGSIRAITLARFRREVRNNPFLAGLVAKYPEAIGNTSLRSRTTSKLYNDVKNLFWFRYAKHVSLAGDSLRTVEDIVIRELLIAGEIFVVQLANGLVQLVPSELCGGTTQAKATPTPGLREVNGVVTDFSGRPVYYRFGKVSDTGAVVFTGTDKDLVPAQFVRHVFDKDRVIMGRGLPWLIPSLKTARDLYEITRSKTKQIKDANSLSGFLEKQGAAKFLDAWGSQTPSIDGATESTPETPDSAADSTSSAPVTVELAAGTFIGLEPGEKANALISKYEATDYKELILIMLHALSTPVGLPVELWFSGLGDVNYSGFKGLGVQWNSRRRKVIGFLEDRLFNPWQAWRSAKAQDEGDLPPNPDRDEDLVSFGWRTTAVLDDEKAAKANQVRLQTGERSLADVWEENGLFAEEVLAGRRELWIKLKIASGELQEGQDHAAEIVPLNFLYRNELPGAAAPSAPQPPTQAP